jgi:hypothetical protein
MRTETAKNLLKNTEDEECLLSVKFPLQFFFFLAAVIFSLGYEIFMGKGLME